MGVLHVGLTVDRAELGGRGERAGEEPWQFGPIGEGCGQLRNSGFQLAALAMRVARTGSEARRAAEILAEARKKIYALLAEGLTHAVRPCGVSANPSWQTVLVDDEELLAKVEAALTEIKVAQGLSERHEAVLAALRIRLKGNAGKSLEEMLEAADDSEPDRLAEAIAKAESKRKPSLDDLLTKEPKKKPDWPS